MKSQLVNRIFLLPFPHHQLLSIPENSLEEALAIYSLYKGWIRYVRLTRPDTNGMFGALHGFCGILLCFELIRAIWIKPLNTELLCIEGGFTKHEIMVKLLSRGNNILGFYGKHLLNWPKGSENMVIFSGSINLFL